MDGRLLAAFACCRGRLWLVVRSFRAEQHAIARALAMRPKLMLFDEPTSALDPELVGDVLEVVRALAHEGMAMLVLTHEMGFAREVGDMVFIDCGAVVEAGDPHDVIADPREERAKAFLGSVPSVDRVPSFKPESQK